MPALMRLLSFVHNSAPSYGVINGDGVVDLGKRLSAPDLKTLLEEDRLKEVEALQKEAPDVPLEGLEYLPVIPEPSKIICVGINYDAHRVETGRQPPKHPVLFVRFSNTLVGHGAPLVRPLASEKFDYEGELAVIIGKRGRRISEAQAIEHIAGYSCFMDGSVRDWQRHSSQFTPGKNFPKTGGFGPTMITTAAVSDPTNLDLVTRLNGQVLQEGNTGQMTFPVANLIAYISTFTELVPGDVIATGTPSGVGYKREPPIYMKQGDRVEVEISWVGTLAHPIIEEA